MKKTFNFILLVLLFSLILISCGQQSNSVIFQAMDTVMSVRSFGKNSQKINTKVMLHVLELESMISVTDLESEVYKLNHADGETVVVSPEVFRLAEYGLQQAKKVDGIFNPVLFPVTSAWGFTTKEYKVPSQVELDDLLKLTDFTKVRLDYSRQNSTPTIQMDSGMAFDFGAIGKGFAGDEIIRILKENGIKSALLDLGGNIQLLGKKPDGSLWNVGLKNPWGGNVPVSVKVEDCAVITSGGYERFFVADDGNEYIHILNGKTGKPVKNNVVSSTIVAKDGIYADFLSTTTFILGKEKTKELWKASKDFEFIMIFEDKSICYSQGLVDRISLLENFDLVEICQ